MKIGAIIFTTFLYFVACVLWSGANPLVIWAPANVRILLPLLIILGFFLRYYQPENQIEDEKVEDDNVEAGKVEVEEVEVEKVEVVKSTLPLQPSTLTGKDLYNQARLLPHQKIPDFKLDGKYLDMLGQSAYLGCPQAAAKLGEYAMRRSAWVEAYYWMSTARLHGMTNLSDTLSEILKNWRLANCPNEEKNIHPLFDEDAGSVGRALLNLAAGNDFVKARTFLQIHYPEYIANFEFTHAASDL